MMKPCWKPFASIAHFRLSTLHEWHVVMCYLYVTHFFIQYCPPDRDVLYYQGENVTASWGDDL